MPDFLKMTREAYEASTAFFEANHQKDFDYSVRAFRSEHAAGSKYLSNEYKSRSRLFRPKTRAYIRKMEAAAAVALFSNMEIVDIQPSDPDNLMSVAARDCLKALIEYRLGTSLPWFQICMGAVQDAQTQGAVISYQNWEYEVRGGRKVKDKPCIELRPIENIRLDGGASWLDPVNSTPYWCDIVPMYVCDVRAMMRNKDEKTGQPKWKNQEDSVIQLARPDTINTVRQSRLGKQQDPHQEQNPIKDFDVVWVMRWFMRDSQGVDHTYYSLGTEALLTDPVPIEDVYFHGIRPYTMGCAVIETHRALKSSVPLLSKQLQQEANDIANQRIDNVKFVLQKRWFVARGRQVDVDSLLRGVPGGVTLVTDPKTDVQESNWPDVTKSAYVEQDRVGADMDDLLGNFTPSTKVANNAVNDTLGGSRMAAQSAGVMSDYMLRTIIETWVEPTLRQLVMLEQHYETDETVLALCAKKAQLFPRYGLSRVSDDLLANQVHVTVNVGMGASNPQERFQKFVVATNAAINVIRNAPPSANVPEMVKEIFSNAGYRDGTRFFSQQQDPRLLQAMQVIQQLQSAMQSKQLELQSGAQVEQAKLASNERIKAAELKVDFARISGDLQIRAAELEVEKQKLELERMKAQVELRAAGQEQQARMVEINADIEQAQMKLEQERTKLIATQQKADAELQKAAIDLQTARETAQNESKIGQVAEGVSKSMDGFGKQIAEIKGDLSSAKNDLVNVQQLREQVGQLSQAVALMLHGAADRDRKKPVGFTLRKAGGKTNAVAVKYADGSSEDLPIGEAA